MRGRGRDRGREKVPESEEERHRLTHIHGIGSRIRTASLAVYERVRQERGRVGHCFPGRPLPAPFFPFALESGRNGETQASLCVSIASSGKNGNDSHADAGIQGPHSRLSEGIELLSIFLFRDSAFPRFAVSSDIGGGSACTKVAHQTRLCTTIRTHTDSPFPLSPLYRALISPPILSSALFLLPVTIIPFLNDCTWKKEGKPLLLPAPPSKPDSWTVAIAEVRFSRKGEQPHERDARSQNQILLLRRIRSAGPSVIFRAEAAPGCGRQSGAGLRPLD